MNRVLACFALALCLPLAAHAEKKDTDATQARSGSGALLFGFDTIISSPNVVDGVGVGGRYFLSDDLALRMALGIRVVAESTEFDPNAGETQDTSSGSHDIAVEGGPEVVLFRKGPVFIYTGGLAQISFGGDDPDGSNNDTSRFGLLIAGVLGANWFLTEAVSLGAEYRLGYQLETTSTDQAGGTNSATEHTFGVGSIGFHLGFWF